MRKARLPASITGCTISLRNQCVGSHGVPSEFTQDVLLPAGTTTVVCAGGLEPSPKEMHPVSTSTDSKTKIFVIEQRSFLKPRWAPEKTLQ
jgi:hypothetical protein